MLHSEWGWGESLEEEDAHARTDSRVMAEEHAPSPLSAPPGLILLLTVAYLQKYNIDMF